MEEYGNFRGRKNHEGRGRQPSEINVFDGVVKFSHSIIFCTLYILYSITINLLTLILIKYIKIIIIYIM